MSHACRTEATFADASSTRLGGPKTPPDRTPSAPRTPPDRTPSAHRALAQRSAVTNGVRAFLSPGGEQSVVGRRWRDLYDAITADRGGADALTEAQRQLARRVATLAVKAELMEAGQAKGKDLDLEAYLSLTNAIGRASARLGLDRVPDNVSAGLKSYIAAKKAEQQS